MDYIANTQMQNDEMLAVIGAKSIDELFRDIPKDIHRKAPVIDDGLSELEGMRLIESIAEKNTYSLFDNYLGAGAYEHHIPAIGAAICQKSEFLTAYTPYQAEISQGMLQSIFEFQSVVCALTGMDVANASVYDGASACAEALLMALRHHKKRGKLLIASTIHPNYLEVINQYLEPLIQENRGTKNGPEMGRDNAIEKESEAIELVMIPRLSDSTLSLSLSLALEYCKLFVQIETFRTL